jgi:two-component system, response regulator PdtaR
MRSALIVDDEPLLRRQARSILELYGFEQLVEADNGMDAVALAFKLEPLLIVMDFGLPKLDGISAAEQVMKKFPTPIVLMTGAVDLETIERSRLAGIMSYVVKPFRDEQMYAAVDLAIHHFVEVHALREEVAGLRETIETRKLVDKAKGVLMKQGLAEPEAYRKMQKLAMDKRKSLKEVAEAIILMGS